MKKLTLFFLLVALAAGDIVAVQNGMLPAWCLLIAGALGTIAIALAALSVSASMAACQVCEKPLADRRAAGDYALKYGVRTCGDCGTKLDRRFRDEPPVPPYPPYLP